MIEIWSQGSPASAMPEGLLVETLKRVRRHPWWMARAKLMLDVLQQHGVSPPASVLEAGCGWGVNMDALEQAGFVTTGFDLSRRVLDLIDLPTRRLAQADLMQALPAVAHGQDAVLALDVIEHLDDDNEALRRLAELLRPGGLLVISVPALPDLWSHYDEIQGHRRRYLPATLRNAFEGTPLQLEKVFYWGSWMVPLLRGMRKRNSVVDDNPEVAYARYLRLPLWPLPLCMRLAFRWEKSRAIAGKLKTGTSLFAVAKRIRKQSETTYGRKD